MGTINYTTSIIGNVTLGADSLTNPTAASTNITLGTANSVFRLYTPINPLYGYPVGGGNIGQIISGNKPPASTLYTGGVQVSRLTLSQTGLYMIHANLLIATNNSQLTYIHWISMNIYNESVSANHCVEERLNQYPNSLGINFMINLSAIVYHQGTSDQILALGMNYSGGQPSYTDYFFKFNAVRIA